MPKLPALTSRKIIKLLKERGFVLDHVSGSHYVFYHPKSLARVTVPYHNQDLPKGTLLNILRQARLDKHDL